MEYKFLITVESPNDSNEVIEAIQDFIELGRLKCTSATKDVLAQKHLQTKFLKIESSNLVSEHIVVDPNIMSGKACLKGTRIPISHLLSDFIGVAQRDIDEIADDYDIDRRALLTAFKEIAVHYDKF